MYYSVVYFTCTSSNSLNIVLSNDLLKSSTQNMKINNKTVEEKKNSCGLLHHNHAVCSSVLGQGVSVYGLVAWTQGGI